MRGMTVLRQGTTECNASSRGYCWGTVITTDGECGRATKLNTTLTEIRLNLQLHERMWLLLTNKLVMAGKTVPFLS